MSTKIRAVERTLSTDCLKHACQAHSLAKSVFRATAAMVQDSAIDNAQVKKEEARQLNKMAKESGERTAVKGE